MQRIGRPHGPVSVHLRVRGAPQATLAFKHTCVGYTVYVNDVPVDTRAPEASFRSGFKPVGSFLMPGTNTVRVETKKADSDACSRYQATFRLASYSQGTMADMEIRW